MYLNGSGATAAYLGAAKIWPSGTPQQQYTYVTRIWADDSYNILELGQTFPSTSNGRVRLKAQVKAYTGELWIGQDTRSAAGGGSGKARFFATARNYLYYDFNQQRIRGNARTFGSEPGNYMDVYLTNFSMYNAVTDVEYSGTPLTVTLVDKPIAVSPTQLYIYGVEVWNDNGRKVGDYRPAMRNSDGLYGLHDVINDVFYTTTDYTIYGETIT